MVAPFRGGLVEAGAETHGLGFLAAFALVGLVVWLVNADCDGSDRKGYGACAHLSPLIANLTTPFYVITYILLMLGTLGVFLVAGFLEIAGWMRRRRIR